MTPLADFAARLSRHDWCFDYADDFRTWQKGRTERTALEAIAAESSRHRALFDAWKRHALDHGPLPDVAAMEAA